MMKNLSFSIESSGRADGDRIRSYIRAPEVAGVITTSPSRTLESVVLLRGRTKWMPVVVKLNGDALLLICDTEAI
jgi:hypothetical protein